VSEIYGVPISVIFNSIKGRKTPMDCKSTGRVSVLPKACEQQIEKCLIARIRMGHPCGKNEVKHLVGEYVKNNKLITAFKDSTPDDDWYYNFMKRHPSLSFKKPEQLQKLRKDARKPNIICDFYEKLENVFNEHNLYDKAKFIFNTDESGFNTDSSRLRAVEEKGKALSRISEGSGRESISVLACVAADGAFLPPFIIFKCVTVQPRWTYDNDFPGK